MGASRVTERYQVRVTKDALVFSAGHYITYNGTECERLHGHNYRTAVTVEAPLDPNHYVFDFIALRDRMKDLVDELDHRMLLAMHNPLLKVTASESVVRVTYRTKEWLFPREDCALLPIENTTAELLAKYLAGRLREILARQYHFTPTRLAIEVEECFGQTATYEWTG
jgi:6-pyruvoyltetrahydropterin/6-carboxytetrahydropterin synthase